MKKIKKILFNKKINYYKFLIVRNVKIHYLTQTQAPTIKINACTIIS